MTGMIRNTGFFANVQDVLRKYGAEYTVSCRDRWFRFTCAIPCAVHDMSTDNL